MPETKLRPEDLRAKAEALIAFTRGGPLFIAWVQAVTDTLAPAPEKVAKAASGIEQLPPMARLTARSDRKSVV